MRISLDLDGVLANFSSTAIQVMRDHFRIQIPQDYVQTKWSFADVLGDLNWMCVFEHMLREPQMWEDLPEFEESIRALRGYIDCHGEHEVYYLTARPDSAGGSAVTSTQLWLMDRGLSFENLMVTKSTKEKKKLLTENLIRYSLDDYAPTVEDCQDIPGHKAYLLDRPYNQDVDLRRVFSVAEFLMEVEFER